MTRYVIITLAALSLYIMTGLGVWSGIAAREPGGADLIYTTVPLWPAVLIGMTVDRVFYPPRGCAQ